MDSVMKPSLYLRIDISSVLIQNLQSGTLIHSFQCSYVGFECKNKYFTLFVFVTMLVMNRDRYIYQVRVAKNTFKHYMKLLNKRLQSTDIFFQQETKQKQLTNTYKMELGVFRM